MAYEESRWSRAQGQRGPNLYRINDAHWPTACDATIAGAVHQYTATVRDIAGDGDARVLALGFGAFVPDVWAAVFARGNMSWFVSDITAYWSEITVPVGVAGSCIARGDTIDFILCRLRDVGDVMDAVAARPAIAAGPAVAAGELPPADEPRWAAVRDGYEPASVEPGHWRLRVREIVAPSTRPPPGFRAGHCAIVKFGVGLDNVVAFQPGLPGYARMCPWKVAVVFGGRATVLGTCQDVCVGLVCFMFEMQIVVARPLLGALNAGDTVDVIICRCGDMRARVDALFPGVECCGALS